VLVWPIQESRERSTVPAVRLWFRVKLSVNFRSASCLTWSQSQLRDRWSTTSVTYIDNETRQTLSSMCLWLAVVFITCFEKCCSGLHSLVGSSSIFSVDWQIFGANLQNSAFSLKRYGENYWAEMLISVSFLFSELSDIDLMCWSVSVKSIAAEWSLRPALWRFAWQPP